MFVNCQKYKFDECTNENDASDYLFRGPEFQEKEKCSKKNKKNGLSDKIICKKVIDNVKCKPVELE